MFFKHRKILIIFLAFGAYLFLEILLNSWLSIFMVDDNYIVEDVPMGFNRITIENLTAEIDKFKLLVLAKKPAVQNNAVGKENQNQEFHYQKIVCKNMLPIKGLYNYFQICYPIRWFLRFQPRQQIAYFINGRRDNEFERNFNKITDNVLLRVFTKQNVSLHYPFKPDSIGNFDIRIYTETNVDVNSNIPIIGIKDLIDARDDYHYMEFMKFEMKDKIDPIVYSINIPVFSAHLLLRLENIAFNDFRHLIEKLAKSIYFPYSIIKQQKGNSQILFVSLMHKYSFYKYGVGEPVDAVLTNFSDNLNNADEL